MKSCLRLAVALLAVGIARAQVEAGDGLIVPSPSDSLDVHRGTVVTGCTPGIVPSPSAAIGGNAGGVEPGNCFCPNVGVGYASFIEILTPSPVTLAGARLFAQNDGAPYGFRHAMSGWRMLADTDGDGTFETTLVDATIHTNYAAEPANLTPVVDDLQLLFTFAPTMASAWRMEFVQGTALGSSDGVRVIEVDGIDSLCQAPFAFCTSGATSSGCHASITCSGTASASANSGFTLTVSGAEPLKQGFLFYGIDNSGFAPTAWGSGGASYLCVKAPTQRMGFQNTGGAWGQCDGTLSIDWNAFRAANPTALGAPFNAGQQLFAQGWFRDPPSVKTTSLSNGLSFALCP